MELIQADVIVVGGGTAGCMAAVEIKERNPKADVLVVEKANVERSGCLAAGMNAINLYLHPGETPESLVRYVRFDSMGLLREDLVLSMARFVNEAVHKVESWGLPIEKDGNGRYERRGRWNVKIQGEALKPILAKKLYESGVRVLNRVVVTNLVVSSGRVIGVTGFGVRDGEFRVAIAPCTIVATGGAAGLYKPNNGGSAHHKIWYCPFNTGSGYAIGIRAGSEMTSLEMRFVALRTKDIMAPTGTLALGFGARQVNSLGEPFMELRYSSFGGDFAPTAIRVYAPTMETKEGRGPCYLDTTHLSRDRLEDLMASYLDMYPGIVLYWACNQIDPTEEPVEICGTEPYIVGGHCQAGYWVDEGRRTTLPGLYAAGDVCGGAPYKFVGGCWAEAMIVARTVLEDLEKDGTDWREPSRADVERIILRERDRVYAPFEKGARGDDGVYPREMEERLQKIMDEYAGGVSRFYEMNDRTLSVAQREVGKLKEQVRYLRARDLHELMLAHEVIDRLDLAEAVLVHLRYRKETRWPAFQTRTDYPFRDDENWLKFVNSRRNECGSLEIIERPYRKLVD